MTGEKNGENGHFKAAIYMRLSKDDGTGESASINNQRSMLRSYAARNGYFIYGEYADDGYSGTTYERPAWKRLIADIEAGRVNLVITRDLSRLGRDYILTGQYTEIYFPAKGVRYIAVNDGYDSQNPGNDLAPFQNIVNEMYARDTSKKIRSALRTKMEAEGIYRKFCPLRLQKGS
ncbi:recombinase family protein [Clostridium boliviensis]|uniref:Recombinase family protein n=1 Tax=Clostridium boliviensis TaxID=318465 RepID=A0ABU4GR38_9CLOT|nr:recombinase family protein [Clostridium boliviensis]MDW2800071.1 recombinase family protein [Clostridium boliviensis]